MLKLRVRWNRLLGIYIVLGAAFLVAGALSKPPRRDILLVIGVSLVAGFVPLVMAIYFLRGLLRIH
jgi:hypothetical protein